jgi:hypothetical protein
MSDYYICGGNTMLEQSIENSIAEVLIGETQRTQ